MVKLPTVQIVDGDSYKIINQRDFNPKLMQLWPADSESDSEEDDLESLLNSIEDVDPPVDITPAVELATQLNELYREQGWQAIKAIAHGLGIEKPADGWDAAIPLIVAAEFGDSVDDG